MSSSDRSRYILDEGDVVVIERPTTETFHLQGQHDQQTHAGDRASSIGADVSLDDLDGEMVEAPAAEIVERFKLYDGDGEYETTSGARLYRAEDDRYVTLEEDDSGVYLDVHSDLYEVDVDVSDLEARIDDSWREDVSRSIVYHGTRDGETATSIMENGLQVMNETRGLNNRWVGAAVYTSTEPELAGSYGQVFEVDLPRAIADGVIDPDVLQREPGFNEADAMSAVANSFNDYSFDAYGQFYGSGEDPQTVVIGASIPPEYLKFDEDGSGSFSLEVFHLQGQHDQQSHAGKNAAGETIAEVGKTIPEDRSADAVLEEWMAPPEEFAAAQKLAAEKARNVPKPTAAQIAKNEAMLAKSKRPGGWGRGNSYTRRARGQALFEEFGGTPGGYCPCGHCGIKVSPRGEGGFAAMTQDKILTASEGGTYGTAKSGFPNLIPACGGCNASRNQASFDVRPAWEQEELPGMAASAGVTTSDEFVAAEATGKPVGWDTWLDVEVGTQPLSGEYITRTVDVWFGPYTQHLIGGETCDPATIRILRDEFGADVWYPMAVTDPASIVQLHMRGRHNQQAHAGGGLPDVPFSDVKIAYRPRHPDGKADPGEVVWAKVPFEERDGRAKDRPVLIIGRTKDGNNLVGVQLTSKPGRDRVSVGSGDWDRQGRESYMDTSRFIQVDDVNYRREGAYMKKPVFQAIADVLTDRQNAPDVDLSVEVFHMAGQHNQQSHAGRGATGASIAGSVVARVEAGESITVSPSEVADVVAQFADQEGPMDLAAIDVEGYPNLFSGARANMTAREDMPQIPKAHLQQFREELEADGIAVEEVQLNATELSATQRQLDAVKVAGVAEAIRTGEFKSGHRIWVSHDNRVLDGHHRWAAAAVVELEGHPASVPLDGYRVDMDMDALLVKARAYNEEHGVDARTYRAHMEALGLTPGQHFHLQGQHDQQSHAGGSAAEVDDYQGGHRPSETGPRIHDLLESEMTDGLDVYQNPHFFTGYAKVELDETMAQLRRVQGDPEANVTIYRAAPEGATINEGDWVSLSKTYADLHAASNLPDGVTPTVLEMDVPAKSVRWAVDDLMEYGYFPDLGEKRIFSEDDFAVQVFHLQGQHDQKDHGRRAGATELDPTSPAARRGWKPLKGVLSERPIEFDDYENRYRMTAANGQQIEAAVFTGNAETNEILRSPAWKQRVADGLNGVTDGYDLAPADGPPPHIIVLDELPFGLPEVANQANAFVASRAARGPVPFAAPFSGDQLQSNTVVFNATDTGREMWDLFEERAAEIMMPSVSTTSVAHYTGIHEYGHTRAADDGTPLLTQMYRRIQPKSLSSISPEWKQLSRYGKSNPAEAHAETFADFVLTGGQPTNAATAYYSSILGWGSDAAIEEALAAAAGTKLRDQWVWCIDSPYGGTLITKAPEGADFHLQGQHDQQSHAGGRGGGSAYTGTAAAATDAVADRARQGLDPSEFDGPLMSRGIAITVSDDLKKRLDTQIGRGADPGSPEEFNQHLELGPEIAEQLLDFEGHQGGAFENTAGFGQSWTTRESVAESVSPGPGQNLVVKVVARPRQSDVLYQEVETDGRHSGWVDADGNTIDRGGRGSDMIPGEMEVRVDGRSPVDIVDIQVRQGNRWESVWGDERGFGAGADELYRQFPHVKDWDLAVEVFHLQGQHDQQSHAGGRGGGSASGTALTNDEVHVHAGIGSNKAGAARVAEAMTDEQRDVLREDLYAHRYSDMTANGQMAAAFYELPEAIQRAGFAADAVKAMPIGTALQIAYGYEADSPVDYGAALEARLVYDGVIGEAKGDVEALSDALAAAGSTPEYAFTRWAANSWTLGSTTKSALALQTAANGGTLDGKFEYSPSFAAEGQSVYSRFPRAFDSVIAGSRAASAAVIGDGMVTVYRGTAQDIPTGGGVEIGMNPMSSWSTDESRANDFARNMSRASDRPGRVLSATVRASDVVSIASSTGIGSQNESELILGAPMVTASVREVED